MFTINTQVTTSKSDANGRLKLVSALQMMQDCSELWKDSEPLFNDYMEQNGMAQLLVSREVEVIRVPEYKEFLTVTSSVFDCKPMFGFRNTFIRDADGNDCYRTWSTGAFVDKNTGRLKGFPEQMLGEMHYDPKLEMNYRDRHVVAPHDREWAQCAPIKVLRDDIDYNRHVNNAAYVRMALELLPADFEVKRMRVEYKRAARLGDELVPEKMDCGNDIYVRLLLNGKPAVLMEFTK